MNSNSLSICIWFIFFELNKTFIYHFLVFVDFRFENSYLCFECNNNCFKSFFSLSLLHILCLLSHKRKSKRRKKIIEPFYFVNLFLKHRIQRVDTIKWEFIFSLSHWERMESEKKLNLQELRFFRSLFYSQRSISDKYVTYKYKYKWIIVFGGVAAFNDNARWHRRSQIFSIRT